MKRILSLMLVMLMLVQGMPAIALEAISVNETQTSVTDELIPETETKTPKAPIMEVVETAEEVSAIPDKNEDKARLSGDFFTFEEWTGANGNSHVVSLNKETARVDSIPYYDEAKAVKAANDYDKSQSEYYMLLSGGDIKYDFKLLNTPTAVINSDYKDFYKADFDSSSWNKIRVPSVWQVEIDPDTGDYYGDGDLRDSFLNTPPTWPNYKGNSYAQSPLAPTVYNPTGLYRYQFDIDKSWEGKRVFIDFEGVGSAIYLWINGHQVGYSEDTYSQKEFDITDYVNIGGTNTLAAEVIQWSDGAWFETYDISRLSGIYRNVYVYATPNVRLRDYRIVTDFDDTYTDATLKVDAFVKNYTDSNVSDASVEIGLYGIDGKKIDEYTTALPTGTILAGKENTVSFAIDVEEPYVWTAETPYLYTVVIAVKRGEEVLSYDSYLVGFREITYRDGENGLGTYADYKQGDGSEWELDNIRLNGNYVYLKGAARHDTGYSGGMYTDYDKTYETLENDIRTMKESNINAVRLAHYPHNPYIYYLCNKYGIYVMAEAAMENGNIAGAEITEDWSTLILDREDSLVLRERNNPSVIIWSLGNETYLGSGVDMDPSDPYYPGILYHLGDYVHEMDSTRPVHFEPPYAGGAPSMDAEAPSHGALPPESVAELNKKYGMNIDLNYGTDMRSNMYPNYRVMQEYADSGNKKAFVICEMGHGTGNLWGGIKDFWDIIRSSPNMQGAFLWDFKDQAIWMTDENGKTYLGNHFDYAQGEPKIVGGNQSVNADGLVKADGTPKPGLYEAKRVLQNVNFEEVSQNARGGSVTVNVINENMVTDLNEYDVTWELYGNDTLLQEGTLDISLAPDALDGTSSTQTVISFDGIVPESGVEYYINITAQRPNMYDPSIVEECKAQIILNTDYEKAPALDGSSMGTITYDDTDASISVSGDNFSASIDKATGLLTSYVLEGTEMLASPIKPNFHRPKNLSATSGNSNDVFKNETYSVLTISDVVEYYSEEELKSVIVTAELFSEQSYSYATITYTIYANGVVDLDFDLTAGDENTGGLPKAGSQLAVNEALDTVVYFGKGDVENYVDRCAAADLGLYTSTVEDMYTDYSVPVENGTRTGVRYMALTDSTGTSPGLLFVGEGNNLQIAASYYTDENVDAAANSADLEKISTPVIDIDYVSLGLGTLSFGDEMLPKYRLDAGEHSYSYSIRPLPAAAEKSDIVAEGNRQAAFSNELDSVKDARKLLNELTTYLTEQDKYTQESFVNFEKAFMELYNSVYNNTGSECDTKLLYDAFGKLVEKTTDAIDTSLLESKISEAKAEGHTDAAAFCEEKKAECNQGGANTLVKYLDYVLQKHENPIEKIFAEIEYKISMLVEEEFKSQGFVSVRHSLKKAQADMTLENVYNLGNSFGMLEFSLVSLKGEVIGETVNNQHKNMFDGDVSTFAYDDSNGTMYGGYNLGQTKAKLKYIKVYPRFINLAEDHPQYNNAVGGNRSSKGVKLQGSVDGKTWVDMMTLVVTADGTWHTLKVHDSDYYNYYRLSWRRQSTYGVAWNITTGSISEAEFYGVTKDITYLEKCLDIAEKYEISNPGPFTQFIADAKAILASPGDYTQMQINDAAVIFNEIADVEGQGTIALTEAIVAFEEIDCTLYSAQSYFAAYDVYEEAKTLLYDTTATDSEKQNKAEELFAAEGQLKAPAGSAGDVDMLEQVITDGSEYIAKNSIFTDVLNDVLGEGNECLGENNSVASVNTAIYNIRNVMFLIDTADSMGIGEIDQNKYTSESYLAYKEAYDKVCSEQTDIALYELKRATDNLKKLDGDKPDLSLLDSTISEAETYYESHPSVALKDAITEAKAARASYSSQTDINNAIIALKNVFEKAMNHVNYEYIINNANKLDENDYSTENYRKLLLMIETARESGNEEDYLALESFVDSIPLLCTEKDNVKSDNIFYLDDHYNGADKSFKYIYSFDGVIPDSADIHTSRTSTRSTLYAGYDFGVGNEQAIDHIILSYLASWNGMQALYKGMKFEGSNDNENWTTIGKITTSLPYKGTTEILNYVIDSTDFNKYRYVRFNNEETPARSGGNEGHFMEVRFYPVKHETETLNATIAEANVLVNSGTLSERGKEYLLQEISAAQNYVSNANAQMRGVRQSEINDVVENLEKVIETVKTSDIATATFLGADGKKVSEMYVISGLTSFPEITESIAGTSDLSHVMWTDGVLHYDAGEKIVLKNNEDQVTFSIVLAPRSYNVASLNPAKTGNGPGIRFKSSISSLLESECKTAGYIVALKTSVEPEDLTFEYCKENNIKHIDAQNIVKFESGNYSVRKIFEIAENGDIFTTVFLYGLDKTNKQQMETPVIARPYVITKDGEYIYGNPICRSMADLAETIYNSDNYENESYEVKHYVVEVLTLVGYFS